MHFLIFTYCLKVNCVGEKLKVSKYVVDTNFSGNYELGFSNVRMVRYGFALYSGCKNLR